VAELQWRFLVIETSGLREGGLTIDATLDLIESLWLQRPHVLWHGNQTLTTPTTDLILKIPSALVGDKGYDAATTSATAPFFGSARRPPMTPAACSPAKGSCGIKLTQVELLRRNKSIAGARKPVGETQASLNERSCRLSDERLSLKPRCDGCGCVR
jgi:hypothetical protein